jgi:hypothetical protein
MGTRALKARQLAAEAAAAQERLAKLTRHGLAALSFGVASGPAPVSGHFLCRGAAVPVPAVRRAVSTWYGRRGQGLPAAVLSSPGFNCFVMEQLCTALHHREPAGTEGKALTPWPVGVIAIEEDQR